VSDQGRRRDGELTASRDPRVGSDSRDQRTGQHSRDPGTGQHSRDPRSGPGPGAEPDYGWLYGDTPRPRPNARPGTQRTRSESDARGPRPTEVFPSEPLRPGPSTAPGWSASSTAPGWSGPPAGPVRSPAPGGPVRPGPPSRGVVYRAGRPERRPRRVRRLLATALVLALVLAGTVVGLGAWAWSRVGRIQAFPRVRVADGPGTTFLLIGSDSRAGLSRAARTTLGTGSDAGARTDTIMVVDLPSDGSRPAIVSIPRDSYVAIPGHGRNKVNAAFAFGGAPLLVRTIESDTGLHIDHVVQIGFGGFAGLVDDLGGVRVCAKTAVRDTDAHISIPAGCQQMAGKTALGYVRARHFDPLGDLGRVQRQRQVVSAIVSGATSPSTLLHPGRVWSLASHGGADLAVDPTMSSWDAVRLARAVRAVSGGAGVTTTVPIADANASTAAGSSVLWDAPKAARLFRSLQAGHGVPAGLAGGRTAVGAAAGA